MTEDVSNVDPAAVSSAAMNQQIMEDEEVLLTAVERDQLQQLTEEMDKMLDLSNTLGSPIPLVEIMSPMEHVAMQQEEVEALTAIYGEDITMLNSSGTCFCIKMKFMSDVINNDDVIKIWFSLPPNYPSVPPVIEIETNTSGTFTYSDADCLYNRLMQEASQHVGATMVFDLVGITLDLLPDMLQRRRERAAHQAAADQERKTQLELAEAIDDKRKGFIPTNLWSELVAGTEFSSSMTHPTAHQEEKDHSQMFESSYYRPQQFVGPITKILEHIPNTLQITRMENILRQDLADRFHQCMQTAYKELSERERKFPMMFNLKPRLMFHGTLTKSLPSIVQHGLVIPGASNQVKVQHGSSHGKGIYLSPNADFSLGYTDGSRLIVCAAIPGRMYQGNYDKGCHSKIHVVISNSGQEWVFFNAAQVLPCYVIQVNTKQKAGPLRNPPPLSGLALEREDTSDIAASVALKEKREKLLARARKFLPYGFGPGSRTVIEEAGDIDDDEEDYGDYQMLRYMEDTGDTDHESQEMYYSGMKAEYSELQHYRHIENVEGQVPTN